MTAPALQSFGERVRALLAVSAIGRDQARTLRRQIEDAAQELIDLLDELDAPDEDLEEEPESVPGHAIPYRSPFDWIYDPTDADVEPTLGWPDDGLQGDLLRGSPVGHVYGWHDGEFEPSLGSVHSCARAEFYGQTGWADGNRDDREDEHDGSEPDEDAEWSLGSLHDVDQRRWALGETEDLEAEHDGREPEDADLEEDHRQLPTPCEWMAMKARPGAMPLPGGYEPIGF